MNKSKNISQENSLISRLKTSVNSSLDLKKLRNNPKVPYLIDQCKNYFDMKKPEEKSYRSARPTSHIKSPKDLRPLKTEPSTINKWNCYHHKDKKGKYSTGSMYLCSKCALDYVKKGKMVYETDSNHLVDTKEKSKFFLEIESINSRIQEEIQNAEIMKLIISQQKNSMKSYLESSTNKFLHKIHRIIEQILSFTQEYKTQVKYLFKDLLKPLNSKKRNLNSRILILKRQRSELESKYKRNEKSELISKFKKELSSSKFPDHQEMHISTNKIDEITKLSQSNFKQKVNEILSALSTIPLEVQDSPVPKEGNQKSLETQVYISFENKEQLFQNVTVETPRKHSGRSRSETQWSFYFKRANESTKKKKHNHNGKFMYSSLDEESDLFGKYLKAEKN